MLSTDKPLELSQYSLKEVLEDLEIEVEDAQLTFDNDAFYVETAIKHYEKAKENLKIAQTKLITFKKKHNIK